MLHCFDRKDEQQLPSNLTTGSAITDKDRDDLEEIKKIRRMLNPIEEVFVVTRQSRLKPGGSKFTPNVVFATDRVEYTPTKSSLLTKTLNLFQIKIMDGKSSINLS